MKKKGGKENGKFCANDRTAKRNKKKKDKKNGFL